MNVKQLKELLTQNQLNIQDEQLWNIKSQNLSKLEVIEKLREVNPSVPQSNIQEFAGIIMDGSSTILKEQFLGKMKKTFDEVQMDEIWTKTILKRIQIQLEKLGGIQYLQNLFEKSDNSGLLSLSTFKQIIQKSELLLSGNDLNRIVKYYQRVGQTINYREFLADLQSNEKLNPLRQENPGINVFLEDLNKYMKENALNSQDLIKNLIRKGSIQQAQTNGLKVEQFCKLVSQFVCTSIKMQHLEIICQILDVDKDGVIDKFDLESFLNRYKFSQPKKPFQLNALKSPQQQNNTNQAIEKGDILALNQEQELVITEQQEYDENNIFPTRPLTNNQMNELNKKFLKASNDKKLSFFEMFQILDDNGDGFITINEINENLDQIIKIPQDVKEAFFAYMDDQKIGMVNYSRFLEVLNKPVKALVNQNPDDFWEWQNTALGRIKQWVQQKELSSEEAFKIADSDFDGELGKKDLEKFLIEVIHYHESEVSDLKLRRLLKLMDRFKRGKVLQDDFSSLCQSPAVRIIEGRRGSLFQIQNQNQNQSQNQSQLLIQNQSQQQVNLSQKSFSSQQQFGVSQISSSFSGVSVISGVSTLNQEWLKNAQNQMGLFISQKYQNVLGAFEEAANNGQKLIYQNFKNWIEKRNILSGFDLSDKLTQQLFSSLDPHKKGFISESDWINVFSQIDFKEFMRQEIAQILNDNFEQNSRKAFNHFASSTNSFSINLEQFQNQLDQILPRRFKDSQILNFWKQHSESDKLSYHTFQKIFFPKENKNKEFHHTFFTPKTHAKTQSSGLTLISYSNPIKNSQQVLDKMKQIIRSSNVQIENVFLQFDKENTGLFSNVEFRNAIRKLNLGLTLIEIDSLINSCEQVSPGIINWKDFIKKILPSDSDLRLIERAKKQLVSIKDNIYQFMLSPKDAFRQFNKRRNGKLNFEEFKSLMFSLNELSGHQKFSLPHIKDLFDFLDIRRDGNIDLHEWMESFRKLDDNIFQQATLNTPRESQAERAKVLQNKRKQYNLTKSTVNLDSQSFGWECSNEFDLVLTIIAKNRKLLAQNFKALQKKKGFVNYEDSKTILQDILSQNGVKIAETNWARLLKFAQKNDVIDFEFMLEVFKQRNEQMVGFPQFKSPK